MKKYAVIHMYKHGDQFEELFDTSEKAILYAEKDWNVYLTKAEKSRTEYYGIMVGDLDDDGIFDLNAADEIKRIYPSPEV